MNATEPAIPLDLRGLEGSNPLGFLTALGTLRLLDGTNRRPRLWWHRAYGGWTARVWIEDSLGESALAEELAGKLRATADHPAFGRWDDLAVEPDDFRELVVEAAKAASRDDRLWADFAAAFGSEATPDPTGSRTTIQDTALRTMSGAGHQHFLQTMRHVLATVTPEHVHKALFTPWAYDDPLEKSTLRWDPTDDVRYALRWRNPSGDPERKKRGSMLGANALAVHALALLPTAPAAGGRLATTGFSRFGRQVAWTWPIWEPPAPLPVVRSLLTLRELQTPSPPRADLARRGIAEVYRSRRITTGKFRNFTPGEPV
jgi:hypothetical protein